MRILNQQDISPISVISGDRLQLWYTDELGKKSLLLDQEIDEALVVNQCAVYQLGDDALQSLGWSAGLAGAYGRKA